MDDLKISEIVSFISRRWQNDCNWLNGNCYWFAYILSARFLELDIYYDPVEGHFYAGKDGQFFDWRGHHILPLKQVIKFHNLLETDSCWYERIVRDCVL